MESPTPSRGARVTSVRSEGPGLKPHCENSHRCLGPEPSRPRAARGRTAADDEPSAPLSRPQAPGAAGCWGVAAPALRGRERRGGPWGQKLPTSRPHRDAWPRPHTAILGPRAPRVPRGRCPPGTSPALKRPGAFGPARCREQTQAVGMHDRARLPRATLQQPTASPSKDAATCAPRRAALRPLPGHCACIPPPSSAW